MKLKSVLKSMDLASLQSIQQFWQLPAPTIENGSLTEDQWVDYIYPRLQNHASFQKAVMQLEDVERNLLSFLAIHGGNMEEKELRKRYFGGEKTLMKDVTDHLIRVGLLFVEKWTDLEDSPRMWGVPEPYLRFIELPNFWKGYLGALLREATPEHLHQIASNGLNLKINTSKREHCVFQIRNALLTPDILRQYIAQFSESDREVLYLLIQRRGVCMYRDLAEMVKERHPEAIRTDSIDYLLNSSGLLFLSSDHAVKFQNLIRMPRDIYYIITHNFIRDTRSLTDLDAINQVDPKDQPKIVLDNGISILRDIVIFAGYIARNSVRRLTNGGIGKKDLKRILPQLSSNKTLKYAQFLASFCIRKKFLIPLGENWQISGGMVEQLQDSHAFYVELYSDWLDTSAWNEEFIEGDTINTDVQPLHLVDIIELRRIVLSNLSKIPFEAWIEGPRFIENLLAQIELQMPKRGGQGRLDKSNRINYLIIESILCESLYWLGLVSLGLHEKTNFEQLGNRTQCVADGNGSLTLDSGDRLDHHFNYDPRPMQAEIYSFHFKINGLGRSILRTLTDSPGKAQSLKSAISLPYRDDMTRFTVLPNLDVIAPPDLNLLHFHKLTAFAEIRHIDVMSTFAITHSSVRMGMDQGLKGKEIIDFLEQSCPIKLPETVYHLINECSNRHGEVSIGYSSGYIKVNDRVLLEDLKNNKSLSPFIKEIISDQLVMLNKGVDIAGISRELQRMGFMPTIENENIHSTAEGRLHISLMPEDLCNLMAVLRFVMEMEEELETPFTEDKARALFHNLRPANQAQFNLDRYAEVLGKRWAKNHETVVAKKLSQATLRYRRQLRELLTNKSNLEKRQTYQGTNPATKSEEIKAMIDYAVENESGVEIRYVRTTQEEIVEKIKPESVKGDKLYAFSDQRQASCAFRITRIQWARLVA